MKFANRVVVIAAALLVPGFSFAQTMQALTRDQVHAELCQLEQVGYDPAVSNDARYPGDLQADEAAIAARGGAVEEHVSVSK